MPKPAPMTEAKAFELLGLSDPDWYEQSATAVREFASSKDSPECKRGLTTRMLVCAAIALLEGKRVKITGLGHYANGNDFKSETSTYLQTLCLRFAKRLTRDPYKKKLLDMTRVQDSMCMPCNRAGRDAKIIEFKDHAFKELTDNLKTTWRFNTQPNIQNVPRSYPSISTIAKEIYNTGIK